MKAKRQSLDAPAGISAVKWTKLPEDAGNRTALMAWIRAPNKIFAPDGSWMKHLAEFYPCACLFRRTVQFPYQQLLFSSVNNAKGKQRFHTAMMYKLTG